MNKLPEFSNKGTKFVDAKEYQKLQRQIAELTNTQETLRKLQGIESGFKPITCADCKRSDQRKIDMLVAELAVMKELRDSLYLSCCNNNNTAINRALQAIDRARAEVTPEPTSIMQNAEKAGYFSDMKPVRELIEAAGNTLILIHGTRQCDELENAIAAVKPFVRFAVINLPEADHD
jgi:hypothetical protein